MQLSRTYWGDWPCEGCVSTTAGHFNLIFASCEVLIMLGLQ